MSEAPSPAELYAVSLSRSLEGDPFKTRPVDWVGGMSFANELGRLIHRLRGHDASAYRPACHLLITRLEAHNKRRIRVAPQILPKLAAFVIRAHIASNCQTCGGRGKLFVRIDGSVAEDNSLDIRQEIVCHQCRGVGNIAARWSDFDGWNKTHRTKAEELFRMATGIVERCDGYAERTMRIQVRELSA